MQYKILYQRSLHSVTYILLIEGHFEHPKKPKPKSSQVYIQKTGNDNCKERKFARN